jgi:hypothetical protein
MLSRYYEHLSIEQRARLQAHRGDKSASDRALQQTAADFRVRNLATMAKRLEVARRRYPEFARRWARRGFVSEATT